MVKQENSVPVARLGELERAVMETLWDLTANNWDLTANNWDLSANNWDLSAATTEGGGSAVARTATARQVSDRLGAVRPLAYTTVLTVLDRLERKGLVRRHRQARAHRYAPIATREAYAAELMLDALGRASDRDAALVRFVDAVSPEEAEVLRRALLTPEGSGEPFGGAPVDPGSVGRSRPDRQESGP